MRLLSFLSEIEKSLLAESPAIDGGAWDSSRIVNFHQGLARLTLTPRDSEYGLVGGTILLQGFKLADGSQCLKAHLNWKDAAHGRNSAVYMTPNTNWKLEASKIASLFLEGPPAQTVASGGQEFTPLAAAVG